LQLVCVTELQQLFKGLGWSGSSELTEPKRLGPRYASAAPRFAWIVLRQVEPLAHIEDLFAGKASAEGVPMPRATRLITHRSLRPTPFSWRGPFLTAHCSGSESMRTRSHEWLLGRPQAEDSPRRRRRGDVQGSGGPHLLRGLSPIKRYVNKAGRGESLAPKKSPGSAPKFDEKARNLLAADLEERPYLTLQERCDYIEIMTGLSVSSSTMCHAIARIGPIGKNPQGKRETRRHGARRVREAAWRVMVVAMVEPSRLLFVDECVLGTPSWHRSTATLPGASA
jgi:transposase